MNNIFNDFNIGDFWEDSEYAKKTYIGPPFSQVEVQAIEEELRYKLPNSYIELMRVQNGGIPKRKNHGTKERTSWAEDHVAIIGIYSIGGNNRYSLLGPFNSKF
jgi:hypothetical protein